MGYPMTVFELYTDGEFKGEIKIVGDATKQWPRIVDTIATSFPEIDYIAVFDMRGEPVVRVTL